MARRKSSQVKMINGIEAEQYFGDVIGPQAAAILEMLLYKFLQNNGEGMSGAQMKLVQFAIERSYGTATRSVEVTTRNDEQVSLDELGDLDEATMRKIASLNAPKDDGGSTIN